MAPAAKQYVRIPVRCPICTQTRLFAARWPIGPVCFPCYNHARAFPRPCARCGKARVLIDHPDRSPNEEPVKPTLCGPCCGSRRYSYICLRCGGGEEPYKGLVCVRCAVADQLVEAFGVASPGSPVAALTAALVASRRPRSVMRWLTNPRGGARVLRELLDQGTAISHEALDTYDEREVWPLRRTLVELEVLPDRHEAFARLDVVVDKVIAELAPAHRPIVRAYASWWYLRRVRRRYELTGTFTYAQFRKTWTCVAEVGKFLGWLSNRDVTLDVLDQPTLDGWLDHATRQQRSAIADFLRWAARRRLTPSLTVTYPELPEPAIRMTEEQRWAELRRCLTDPTIPDDLRAAGALLLLYGVPLARIRELTREHLVTDTDRNLVTGFTLTQLGPTIEVPPHLGRILARLPAATPTRGAPLIAAKPARPQWLFPGRGTRGHITHTSLAARLNAHGIAVRPSRNAALISLASDLPAAVVADLIGMNAATAVRWAQRAARDWAGYVSVLEQRDRDAAPHQVRRPFG